jgi:ABC-type sugar transport system permease subunit
MQVRYLPYILIAPVSVFLGLFFLYPFYLVAQTAFHDGAGWSLKNFQEVTSYWKFPISFKNTLWLAAVVVPVQLALALLMATMVNAMKKGRDLVLYIWTIPLGISDLAAGIIWLAIFEQSGFLNSMMHGLGFIDRPTALISYQNPTMIFVAIALAEIWRATAIMLVILVAGIGLIPKEYYEAAQVFGAGRWKQFVRITLPLLRPSLSTALVLRVILAFEVFAVVQALGGTLFPVLMSETYAYQFELLNGSAAAAVALIILGISIASTIVILRVLRVPKGATYLMTMVSSTAQDPRRTGRYVYVTAVFLLCAWVLGPLYLLFVNTLSSPEAVNSFPKAYVPEFNFESIEFFMEFAGMTSALWNSIQVATLTMIMSILVGAPAGYALSRFEFKGKETFRILILLTRAFPLPLLALPLAVLFIRTGLDDTIFGLALVHTTLAVPFAVLITFSLFSGIPMELEEAAWTLGCNRLTAFIKVVLPLILPGITASAIFAFVISWNEVFAAAVLTIENRTLTAFLLQNLDTSALHLKFAGGFILVVPALIFIFAVRKYLFAMWGIANR